ncbi:MAG: CADD family putative folate metabolism protein [Alphaproteobacteria bacterium]|nr:CADD family putative folate metabolism protein [Alphaproteobacteria bacterium]
MPDGQGSLSASQSIDLAVARCAMLTHPFYQAWTEGRLPLDALKDYSRQYFHHVEAFPRAVSAVHAQCPDAQGRKMLAENLMEEEGLGEGKTDHATLWMDFARGLGVSAADVRGAVLNPETEALIEAFRTLSRQSYAAGLGALYAYESQLPDVAATKIAGLVGYGVTDSRTIRFFAVHERADVEHAAVCRDLLNQLSPEDRAEAQAAADTLAQALWGFLDGVQRTNDLH